MNKLELDTFCDRLLHSLLECCHPTLTVDAKNLTVQDRGIKPPRPHVCQRLPLVMHALCALGQDLFIGPALFARCMHIAPVLLEGTDSMDLQQAVSASACALTMLSALKVSSANTLPALIFTSVLLL